MMQADLAGPRGLIVKKDFVTTCTSFQCYASAGIYHSLFINRLEFIQLRYLPARTVKNPKTKKKKKKTVCQTVDVFLECHYGLESIKL